MNVTMDNFDCITNIVKYVNYRETFLFLSTYKYFFKYWDNEDFWKIRNRFVYVIVDLKCTIPYFLKTKK